MLRLSLSVEDFIRPYRGCVLRLRLMTNHAIPSSLLRSPLD